MNMKKTTTKIRIFKVLEYLEKYSDIDHPISIDLILSKLENNDSITASKYAIYDDIRTLNDAGYDVVFQRNKGYYINHNFQEFELKLLLDSLCNNAKFLSVKRTNEIIDKLLEHNSNYQIRQLKSTLYYDKGKIRNDRIIYNINNLLDAIKNSQEVSFKYFDLNIDKKPVYRYDEKITSFTPYSLVWYNKFYYCIGYSSKYQNLIKYRVDKMESINSIRKVERLNIDVNEYIERNIDMYSGTKTNVTLKCKHDLANPILDTFSQEIILMQSCDDYFIINLNVDPTITFISWLVQYTDRIEVLKPDLVRENIKSILSKTLSIYE